MHVDLICFMWCRSLPKEMKSQRDRVMYFVLGVMVTIGCVGYNSSQCPFVFRDKDAPRRAGGGRKSECFPFAVFSNSFS